MLAQLLAVVVLAVSIFMLLPAPPATTPAVEQPRVGVPSPILSTTLRALVLDSLTIIPISRLPAIKFPLPLIPTYKARVEIKTSETVFERLRVGEVLVAAKDAGREDASIAVKGVSMKMTTNLEIRLVLKKDGQEEPVWRLKRAGRVACELDDATLDLATRLVKSDQRAVQVKVSGARMSEGKLRSLALTDFGWIASNLVSPYAPYLSGTFLTQLPLNALASYFAREILESAVVDDLLAELVQVGEGHLDFATWADIESEERQAMVETAQQDTASTSDAKAAQMKAEGSAVGTDGDSQAAERFHLSTHLLGRTNLRSFLLPSFSPKLYREGGTRAKLQSFNLLTEEVKLDLEGNEIEKIGWEKVRVGFESDATKKLGGKLVIVVDDLEVILKSGFKVHAKTQQAVSWTTGVSELSESGTSKTVVRSRTLQIAFDLSVLPAGSEPRLSLSTASISPFTSITPSFTLSSRPLALGANLLNVLTSALETQIAAAASIVVREFMRTRVREELQKLMARAEENVRESGVEWAGER